MYLVEGLSIIRGYRYRGIRKRFYEDSIEKEGCKGGKR